MVCQHVKIGDTPAIVCNRWKPRRKCSVRGCTNDAQYLCDAPKRKSRLIDRVMQRTTCDRALCSCHAYQTGADRHACAEHYAQTELVFSAPACGGSGSRGTRET